MKHSILLPALMLGLIITSSASAQTADVDAGADAGVQTTFQAKVESQKELNRYILQRQLRAIRERNEDHEGKNQQLPRHNFSLFRRSVDTRQTSLRRSGAFTSDFTNRRPATDKSIDVPNNPKRNFRVRAVDYYVEGGEAGERVLRENVRRGSDPALRSAENFNKVYARRGAALAIRELREVQKARRTIRNSTSFVPFSQKIGDSNRNFLHPFQKFAE